MRNLAGKRSKPTLLHFPSSVSSWWRNIMLWVSITLVLCCGCVASSQQLPEGLGTYGRSELFNTQTKFNDTVSEERVVTSEQRKDGIHHKVTITKKVRVPYTIHVEKRIPKIIEVPVDKPFNVYVPKPYPVIVEKKVPYEIKVPQPQPYTVEKKVPYPVKVLVDKPYTLHVPKPYPVEVEKKFEFKVEKKVPVEVKVPVERPYPVHVIVEKEVKFPVETKVPVPIRVPYDKPVPIHVQKLVPVHVDKPVPYTIEKVQTYPVEIPFRIPIKLHYPENASQEATKTDLNSQWTEAMATTNREVRTFQTHHPHHSIRQGFSGGFAYRTQNPKTRFPFYLPQKNFISHRTPYFAKPVLPARHFAQQNPPVGYEVNESEAPSEFVQTMPFLTNPDSEIIAPQLLIGNPTDQVSYQQLQGQISQPTPPPYHFTSQNTVNPLNNTHFQGQTSDGRVSFHSTHPAQQHWQPSTPQQETVLQPYTAGERFKTSPLNSQTQHEVQNFIQIYNPNPGKQFSRGPHAEFLKIEPHKNTNKSQVFWTTNTNQGIQNVESSNDFKPTSKFLSFTSVPSDQNWQVSPAQPKVSGWSSSYPVEVKLPHKLKDLTASYEAQNLRQNVSPGPQNPPPPPQPFNSTNDTSTSYFSKTVLGNQGVSYETSIQHTPAIKAEKSRV